MNLGAAVNSIIADLGTSDTSLTAIVQQQVLDAVSFYESTRFWFNEGAVTLTTSSSLANYALPAAALPLVEIDSVRISVNGSRYKLNPENHNVLDAMDLGTVFGQPAKYSYFAEQFRLYPVPTATYTFVVSGQFRLATLSATTDTNAFLTHGLNLISTRVQKILQATKYKNPAMAASCAQLETQELLRLQGHTERLTSSGKITPGY
jgi:hypothetical protein